MPGQALTDLTVFAFGKLPAHGDFVARGLTATERDAWDAWASADLQAARETLGVTFEDHYDVAPPWRFAFGPGPLGDGWRAGAMTPSVDRAGRRFILVVGAKADDPLSPDGVGADVAEAMENAIYRAFETGEDIDALVVGARDALTDLHPDTEAGAAGRFWTLSPPQSIIAPQPPADLLVRALTSQRGQA